MAGIYVHIPICKSRCIYCDFYSTTEAGRQQELAQALVQEIELRKNYLPDKTINTLYFGGGTPSALRSEYVKNTTQCIRNCFILSNQAEITLEGNPDDLTPAYLEQLRHIGINRLSIGIQSFNNRILRFINRRHNAEQAIAAVHHARQAGFDNISIDLIYGFPGQSTDAWIADLDTALSLPVQHISAYGLTCEPGTPLGKKIAAGQLHETADEQMNTLFDLTDQRLQAAGYEHYEVSNFARPGFRSAHNSAYWNGTPYMGIGPAAHSFDGTSRQWNICSLSGYITAMQRRENCFEREELTLQNRYNEQVMLALRTAEGIDMEKLTAQFGPKYRAFCLKQAESYLKSGGLALQNGHLKATRQGVKILNLITEALLDV